jgi:hypothetical protein
MKAHSSDTADKTFDAHGAFDEAPTPINGRYSLD